jgi:hypothetical protein
MLKMTIKKNHPSGFLGWSEKISTMSKDIFEQKIFKPPLPPIA